MKRGYRVLFDNGGIPMSMSFDSEKEAEDFIKSGARVLKREYPTKEARK